MNFSVEYPSAQKEPLGRSPEAVAPVLRTGIAASSKLAYFLSMVTLKFKEFAAAITDYNVQKEDIFGTNPIAKEYVKNNGDVHGF